MTTKTYTPPTGQCLTWIRHGDRWMLVTCLPDGSVTINAKVVLECDQKPPEPWASMLKGSPDLLEACKALIAEWDQYFDAEQSPDGCYRWSSQTAAETVHAMRRLVAKAEGGAA